MDVCMCLLPLRASQLPRPPCARTAAPLSSEVRLLRHCVRVFPPLLERLLTAIPQEPPVILAHVAPRIRSQEWPLFSSLLVGAACHLVLLILLRVAAGVFDAGAEGAADVAS